MTPITPSSLAAEQRNNIFRRRLNMIEATEEAWRPQLFTENRTRLSMLIAAVRRFFDIQAGSAWRDLNAILPRAEGNILDVGCGAQPFRRLVNPLAMYRGIDTDAAKTHFGYEMPDTTYFSGERWPIKDESIDLVLSTETLEHVLDTDRFLAEAARCLIPGGTLLLTVPFAARWHFVPYDYWRFTPSCLDHLLQKSGFEQCQVYARGNALTVACYKTMALILRLLIPQHAGAVQGTVLRLIGVTLLPVFILLATVANASLRGRGGDDCLGYTVIASKRSTDG